VGGRDGAVRFGMFNDRVLGLLSDAAASAAEAGELPQANRFSETWRELRIAIDEAETYNLDRKQHALNMIFRLNDTFRM
jgi:DNA polymerase III subunit delta'